MKKLVQLLALFILASTGHAELLEKVEIRGRAEVRVFEKCLEISLFLVNPTEKSVSIITSYGTRQLLSVNPVFCFQGHDTSVTCTPARNVRRNSIAGQSITTLELPPNTEVPLGVFVILKPDPLPDDLMPGLKLRLANTKDEVDVSFQKAVYVESGPTQPAAKPADNVPAKAQAPPPASELVPR